MYIFFGGVGTLCRDVKGQRSSSALLVISSTAPLGKFRLICVYIYVYVYNNPLNSAVLPTMTDTKSELKEQTDVRRKTK